MSDGPKSKKWIHHSFFFETMMTMTTKIDIPENEAVVASPVTNAMAGYEQKMGHRCCGW